MFDQTSVWIQKINFGQEQNPQITLPGDYFDPWRLEKVVKLKQNRKSKTMVVT